MKSLFKRVSRRINEEIVCFNNFLNSSAAKDDMIDSVECFLKDAKKPLEKITVSEWTENDVETWLGIIPLELEDFKESYCRNESGNKVVIINGNFLRKVNISSITIKDSFIAMKLNVHLMYVKKLMEKNLCVDKNFLYYINAVLDTMQIVLNSNVISFSHFNNIEKIYNDFKKTVK